MYLISDETNGIGGCATARGIEERNGRRRGKEKKRKREREREMERAKKKGKKAGKLAQSLSGAPNPPPQQFPGHRLFVYIGSSISIYNTPSPHAAAASAASAAWRMHTDG